MTIYTPNPEFLVRDELDTPSACHDSSLRLSLFQPIDSPKENQYAAEFSCAACVANMFAAYCMSMQAQAVAKHALL